MKKGDIVLIPFPFSDLQGSKCRPAVVLISTDADITVCFITAQLKWQDAINILIEPSIFNGLKMTSLIRLNKFATIDKDLVIGKLGELENSYRKDLNKKLIKLLKLNE